MSDININLDGVITFLVATGLGLVLLLAILVTAAISLIRARRNHEPPARQRLFAQVIGMFVSLFCCVVLLALLLYVDSMPPPRTIGIWLDKWLWVWLVTVIALWPVSAFVWKKWSARPSFARRAGT